MNHPKIYFTTPLSNLAKISPFDMNSQFEELNEEENVQNQQSPLTIIHSRLNRTIVEEFILPPTGKQQKKQDWKSQFIWL